MTSEYTDHLIVHESLHPFLNPIVAAHRDAWRSGAEAAFAAHEDVMRSQAYGSPDTLAKETAVRAWTTGFFLQHVGGERACAEVREDAGRGFHGVGRVALEVMAHPGDPAAVMRELGDALEASASVLSIYEVFGRSRDEVIIGAPDDGPVRAYAERMAGFLEGRKDLPHRVVSVAAGIASDVDVVYGTPADVPGLDDLLTANGFAVAEARVSRGERAFEGEHVTLVAVLDRPGGDPMIVYTGTSSEAVDGANSVFHGPTRYVIAERRGDQRVVLTDRDPAGEWPDCAALR